MTTYAITGASGQLGRLAAERLLELVDPSEVVLLSRTPDSLREFAERGVTTRAVDFTDPATLDHAFDGVDRVLLVSTDAVGARLEPQQAAIDAMAKAGVQLVAYTSLVRPELENPAGVVPDHHGTEEHLRASGLNWIMLRNAMYADMQVGTLQQAASSGRLVTNIGDGRTSYVTRADCAAAAVAALVGDAVDVAYDITGPDALSAKDLAALAGAEVDVVDVDDAAYTDGLMQAGLPAEVAELLTSFGRSTRGGYADVVSTAVADLTGTAPTPLRSLLG